MPVMVNGQISIPGAQAVRPTVYRYAVLIARAKELAQQAAQVEALFLGAAVSATRPLTLSIRPARN